MVYIIFDMEKMTSEDRANEYIKKDFLDENEKLKKA